MKKGKVPWNKGKKDFKHRGLNHPQWKEKPTKTAIHLWVARYRGRPVMCEHCLKNDGYFDWANIDHKYKRNLNDYMSLCRSCHRKYDFLYNGLKSNASLNGKWAQKYDFCIKCNTTKIIHFGKGFCKKCYRKEYYLLKEK